MSPHIDTVHTVDTILGDIAPSLVPSSACQRRAFCYLAQRLSPLESYFTPSYPRSNVACPRRKTNLESAAYHKVHGR